MSQLTVAEQRLVQEAITLSRPVYTEAELVVIRQAQADEQRRQANRTMYKTELLNRIGMHSMEDLDAGLTELVLAGFPYRQDGTSDVIRTVETNALRQSRPSIQAERYVIERWLNAFDVVACRMGYTRPKKVR